MSAFARGKDLFASVGADGSVRMFDLRSLVHSTIIYEVCSAIFLLCVCVCFFLRFVCVNMSTRIGPVDAPCWLTDRPTD